MWMKFGDDWSKTATCIATQTNKQTDKQTDERAIGDCVLAKISQIDDHCDDNNDNNVNYADFGDVEIHDCHRDVVNKDSIWQFHLNINIEIRF